MARPAAASAASSALGWLYFVSWSVSFYPQAVLNYRRKSTRGWVVDNVLLDFCGGSLSLTQELLDAGCSRDWSAISGDVVKFALGLSSMAFDTIFLVQHYLLYHERARVHLLRGHAQQAFVGGVPAESAPVDSMRAEGGKPQAHAPGAHALAHAAVADEAHADGRHMPLLAQPS